MIDRRVTHHAPRVVVYAGTSKLETRLDETWAKGYAVGFPDLIRFVMAQVPQSEGIDNGFVRPDEGMGGSRRFAGYVPFWA